MKKIIALALIAVSFNSFAGQRTKNFSVRFKATTEAEVVAKAEALIPALQEGEDRSIRRQMSYEQCWPIRARYIKIGSLNVAKSYVFDGTALNPVFTGRLTVSHTKCREDRD